MHNRKHVPVFLAYKIRINNNAELQFPPLISQMNNYNIISIFVFLVGKQVANIKMLTPAN